MLIPDLPDPRVWPSRRAAEDAAARLNAAAIRAINAATGNEAGLRDAESKRLLEAIVAAADGHKLADAFAAASSPAVARYLWRLLSTIERGHPERVLHATLFALPVILVSALEAHEGEITLSGVLPDARALEALLRDEREFGGARTLALSTTLIDAAAIDLARLPGFIAHRALDETQRKDRLSALDFEPAPIEVRPGSERVHLRFIACAVLTAPGTDPQGDSSISGWGMRFAQSLARQLGVPGLSLLALPRPPQRLVMALQTGRAAQREVSAQVFASNAIRKLRASVGEPTAIISAHRAADAAGGGELRLSLSSPFAPRDAEGFRCPLYPYETVQDVAAMLAGLLRDCRVSQVHVLPAVHADIDPATGGPLLFKDAGAASVESRH